MIDTTETKQATIDNLADLDFNEIVDMESIAQENLPHELEAKILNIVEIDELIQSAREKAEQAVGEHLYNCSFRYGSPSDRGYGSVQKTDRGDLYQQRRLF